MGTRIDLNGDVGESFGPWPMGADEALIPLLTSVNVACGLHAGDPLTIRRTIEMALAHEVRIGAHPGYPDLVGFGRRDLSMARDELEASLVYQIAAVAGMAQAAGGAIRHVKPHGALYNKASRDRAIAEAIASAVRAFDPELVLVGMAGSALLEAGRAAGLRVSAEGFADRQYEPDGTLRSRGLSGAILSSPEEAAAQALGIARDCQVSASDGSQIAVRADTICIHGDTPGAVEFARAIRSALEDAGVTVAAGPNAR